MSPGPLYAEPAPKNAVVMSAVTDDTGWLPTSAAAARAAVTMVLTWATRGNWPIRTLSAVVVRGTLTAV